MQKVISITIVLLIASMSSNVFAQSNEEERERKAEQAEERARARYRAATNVAVGEYTPPEAPEIVFPEYTLRKSGSDFVWVTGQGGSSSQLSLSKKFEGETNENDGSFDVDEAVSFISISIMGSVKEGEIEIVLSLPDGDDFKEFTIDTSADITFTQSIKISDDEDKYFGQWEYSVASKKAVGNYRLAISTR